MVQSTPHVYDRGLYRYIRFFENPVDFINSPVYRDGCEFSGIFPENPVGLAGMHYPPRSTHYRHTGNFAHYTGFF